MRTWVAGSPEGEGRSLRLGAGGGVGFICRPMRERRKKLGGVSLVDEFAHLIIHRESHLQDVDQVDVSNIVVVGVI